MKYWSFSEGFGLENLIRISGELPTPGPRDVLLEMRAASLNYRDLVVMRGQHGKLVQPPLVPVSDGVGIVIDVGSQVSGPAIGDRASPAFYQHWQGGPPPTDLDVGRLGGPLNGVLATHCVFPASSVVAVPPHLSDEEAATLPCAGVTAWSALSEPSPVRPGETVLILGSGGVALMALSLARASGARTIVTTSSAAKSEKLLDLGADLVIDRSIDENWARTVRKATDEVGCDRVLELGGAATLSQSIKAVRTGGTIILIGNVTGNNAELYLPLVLTRRLTLHSVTCGSRAAFEALNRALEQHDIRPVISKVVPFQSAPAAFAALETHQDIGNICISSFQDGDA
ncbi:MAG: NAD(P)-dependent alcohol dehydrogenase [Roseibium sp.]|uniref:zinc-dependent alcohol dehydrogenase family protein n=1 Tax=Roseibium sp. TaxID=1936156 RepID=UPI002607F4F3|nr:NAD(P)-dependent alcohol dehydrogenase [Roseibium sp.]MCV0424394.1 NAD(P)-dependent alcohol dehydrogenase [Roseibium sp.]